ncbi:IclR family transcriptional regulator [Corynebacterium bovis]|uniref:IclR family transcriptional regulator n=1 Tax=Corynebacterium bovis TaxID=36808 RepID=UPI0026795DE9|nr:IclR family transcriptional regulator [Corynebacterium bovis]
MGHTPDTATSAATPVHSGSRDAPTADHPDGAAATGPTGTGNTTASSPSPAASPTPAASTAPAASPHSAASTQSASQSSSKTSSGIQVLDRALHILTVVAHRPCTLSELCEATSLPRATAHRIAVALEKHRLVTRLDDGQWTSGPALLELAPTSRNLLEDAAERVLPSLMQKTGESVQLYKLSGIDRVCIAASEPAAGLRDTVPVGARMTLTAGSAAKVLVAFGPPALVDDVIDGAVYTRNDLATVRRVRLAESSSEREAGLASASVPVTDSTGAVVAALSISGPVERMGPSPGARYRVALHEAADALRTYLG